MIALSVHMGLADLRCCRRGITHELDKLRQRCNKVLGGGGGRGAIAIGGHVIEADGSPGD